MADTLIQINEVDKFVLENFPTPLAVNYKQVLDSDSWEIFLGRLNKVFENTFRFITLVLVSDYVNGRNNIDKPFNNQDLNKILLQQLPRERKTLGIWRKIFDTAMSAYEARRDLMFMPNLYDFYWEYDDKGSFKRRVDVLRSIDALMKLRNATVHQKLEGGLKEVGEKGLADFRTFAGHCSFFNDYSLIRVVGCEKGRYKFELFRGLVRNRMSEGLDVKDEIGHWFYLYSLTKPDGGVLSLYPLLIFWENQTSTDGDQKFDVGIYEELHKSIVNYVAVSLNRTLKQRGNAYAYINTLLWNLQQLNNVKHVEKIKWEGLQAKSRQMSKNFFDKVSQSFAEELYVTREDLFANVLDFLESDKTGMVITGQPGVGKTTFLRSLPDKLADYQDFCFLVVSCTDDGLQDLNPFRSIISVNENPLVKFIGQVVNAVLVDVGGERISLRDIVSVIRNPGGRPRKMVLIFDAINEHLDAIKLLKWLNHLIKSNVGSWLKVVITSRESVWAGLSKEAKLSVGSYYQPVRLKNDAYQPLGRTVAFQLNAFSSEELRTAYKKYESVFYLKSSYESLSSRVKQCLRDPFVLRLVAMSYQGRKIPDDLQLEQVYKDYVETLDDDDLDFIKSEILPRMLPANSEDAVAPNLGNWRNEIDVDVRRREATSDEAKLAKMVFSGDDGSFADKRLSNLVRYNLLSVQISNKLKFEISFQSDRFFDYFGGEYICLLMHKQEDPVSYGLSVVEQISSKLHMWGTVRRMVLLELRNGNYRLIEAFAKTSSQSVAEICVDALTVFGNEDAKAVEILLLKLLDTKPEKKRQSVKVENAGLIAVEVAYRLKLEKVLICAALDVHKKVSDSAVRHIFYWWKQDEDTGYRMLWKLSVNEKGLGGLLQFLRRNFSNVCVPLSSAILFSDVSAEGANMLRKIWQNIFEALYITRKRTGGFHKHSIWAPMPTLWILSVIIGPYIKIVEGSGVGNFNFQELELFFKKDKTLFARLVPYIDAQNTNIDDICDDLVKIVADRGTLSWNLVLMLGEAHLFRYPKQTLPIIDAIFQRAVELAEKSGATPGPYFMVCILILTEGIAVLGDDAPPEMMRRLQYYIETYQKQYRCSYYGVSKRNGKDVRISRFSQLGRYMDLYYKQHKKIDQTMADLFLDMAAEDNDIEGIDTYVNIMRYTGGNLYTDIAAPRLNSLHRVLEKTHEQGDKSSWWRENKEYIEDLVVDVLATLRVHFPEEIDHYLYEDDRCMISSGQIERIRGKSGKEVAGDLLESSGSQWVVRNVNTGENRYAVSLVMWLLSQAVTAKSFSQASRILLKMIVNLAYREYIFDNGQPL